MSPRIEHGNATFHAVCHCRNNKFNLRVSHEHYFRLGLLVRRRLQLFVFLAVFCWVGWGPPGLQWRLPNPKHIPAALPMGFCCGAGSRLAGALTTSRTRSRTNYPNTILTCCQCCSVVMRPGPLKSNLISDIKFKIPILGLGPNEAASVQFSKYILLELESNPSI